MEEDLQTGVDRPLTTDEIRSKANKWTLAGDVGLLGHLEQFSKKLLTKSQETEKNINALLDKFEDTSTTVNNITNQFLALQNSQFVENRVYDDESPTEEKIIPNSLPKEEQEKRLIIQYKEAVEIGIKLLDTHFEEVELPPNSDSDEEEISTENTGLVWKPVNPYADKRFPLLIGSAEWWSDDNVGLGEYEENVNPGAVLPESDSEMEVEDNVEKRIRLSSSSSSESDGLLDKNPKGHLHSDLFRPTENNKFTRHSNLFSDGEEEIFEKPCVHVKEENTDASGLFTNKVAHDKDDIDNLYSSKVNDKSVLTENDMNDDKKAVPEPNILSHNKFQNAFTRELAAKLSSVVNNKNTDESKVKTDAHKISSRNGTSALFAENDDNDDLFSTKISTSNKLFKKQSIFPQGSDELFNEEDNLFSGLSKSEETYKNTFPNQVKRLNVKDNDDSKLFDATNKVLEEDVFASNDDFLFSGKSVFGQSQGLGGLDSGTRESRTVKFSTPTEQKLEVPNANIFGGISEIRNNVNSSVESVSVVSNDVDSSFNFARYLSDESKDDGFVEPSYESKNKSEKSENSGLFEPKLSSTRNVTSETSDYKSQKLSSSQGSHFKTDSFPSHNQNACTNKMGNSEKNHFSRHQSGSSITKGLFPDEDEEDDLFKTSKEEKPAKESLFEAVDDYDDLFSNLQSKDTKHQSRFPDKSEGSNLFYKSSGDDIFDGNEEKLFDKVKQQESASMSSSHSSLFDDLNIGKSTLATVFEKDKPVRSIDYLFTDTTDDQLFNEKVLANSVDAGNDDQGFNRSKTNNRTSRSLFEDLEDEDDIFGGGKSQNIFDGFEDATDFCGKLENEVNDKSEDRLRIMGGRESVEKMKDQVDKGICATEPSNNANISRSPIEKADSTQNIFSSSLTTTETDFLLKADIFSDTRNPIKPQGTFRSIFDEPYDDDDDYDDLFKNIKSEKRVFDKKIEKTGNLSHDSIQNPISSFLCSSEDDIFNVLSSKKNIPENISDISVQSSNAPESLTTNEISYEGPNGIHNVKNSDNELNNIDLGNNNTNDSLACSDSKSKVMGNKKLFKTDGLTDVSNVEDASKQLCVEGKSEDGVRPSPPNTLNIHKKLEIPSNSFSEPDVLTVSTEKSKVIGKLCIPTSLKINPMTLLPGAAMKKNMPENMDTNSENSEQKVESVSETSDIAPNLLKCLSKDRVKIQTRRRPQSRRARQEALRFSGIDFNYDFDYISSLTARSKSVDDFANRMAVPPAVKSSSDTSVTADDRIQVTQTEEKVNAESSSSVFHSAENSPDGLFSSPLPSNPLSPSTDEEDFFNVPELDINFEREDQSIFKSNVKSVDSDHKSDDSLLFDGAPVLSPMNPVRGLTCEQQSDSTKAVLQNKTDKEAKSQIIKRRMILDDDEIDNSGDDDDDLDSLFKSSAVKPIENFVKNMKAGPKTNIFDNIDDNDSFLFQNNENVPNNRAPLAKSIFDDINDESDDLFSDKSSSSNSVIKIVPKSNTKVTRSEAPEKLKEPFIDPLGLMTRSK